VNGYRVQKVAKEIGSGVNDNRKKFLALLPRSAHYPNRGGTPRSSQKNNGSRKEAMQLVEQHLIRKTDPCYAAIDAAAFASKNLYNQAT
jgi:hypothetical protein